MASYNHVTLVGNITRDIEIRVLPKGTSVAQFGIAINRSFTGEDGQKREEVTFVDLEAWGKTAELIAKYLGKGSLALFSGRLKLDSWTDATTQQKRSKLKVVVENVQFLGSPKGSEDRREGPATERTETKTVMNSDAGGPDVPY